MTSEAKKWNPASYHPSKVENDSNILGIFSNGTVNYTISSERVLPSKGTLS